MIFLNVVESREVRYDVQVCLSVCTNVPEIKCIESNCNVQGVSSQVEEILCCCQICVIRDNGVFALEDTLQEVQEFLMALDIDGQFTIVVYEKYTNK